MRRIATTVAVLSLIALAALGATGVTAAGDIVGHVYVNDNTAGINTVSAFNRHADGSLTAMPGSPFDIGGAGTGTNIGSQGAIQLSSDGRYLLAVDAGSNEISVAAIRPDGSLRPVEGSPVS